MSRIAVAGIVNLRFAVPVDRFPVPFASSRRLPGGLSARLSGVGWTMATTLQALGREVLFATYVGQDSAGEIATAALNARGLAGSTTLRCQRLPRAVVLYDPSGTRAGTTDLADTPTLSFPPNVFAAAIDRSDCAMAVLTNIGFTRPLIPACVERGIPIATDLHTISTMTGAYHQPWMRSAHILACSHERLPVSPETWIRWLWRRYGTDLVLVGCGKQGALLGIRATRRIVQLASCSPRTVVYTSGAGDTLLATFAHFYLNSGDPIDAARHAVLAAGWKVGADPEEDPATTIAGFARLLGSSPLPATTVK